MLRLMNDGAAWCQLWRPIRGQTSFNMCVHFCRNPHPSSVTYRSMDWLMPCCVLQASKPWARKNYTELLHTPPLSVWPFCTCGGRPVKSVIDSSYISYWPINICIYADVDIGCYVYMYPILITTISRTVYRHDRRIYVLLWWNATPVFVLLLNSTC